MNERGRIKGVTERRGEERRGNEGRIMRGGWVARTTGGRMK